MSNEEAQEAVRKGILDIPTVITKVNDILDMVNPALLAILQGQTGVNLKSDINIGGVQLHVETNIKLVSAQ